MVQNKRPETYLFTGNAQAPNNPSLPVLVYRQVLNTGGGRQAEAFEERYAANGWSGSWRDTIYTYRHFHSNAHEVLGIAEGHITLEIGGEEALQLEAGDIVILPAGVAHKRLSKAKVLVVGAYPKGQAKYDLCRRLGQCPHAHDTIAKVALPSTDPVYGKRGALVKLWQASRRQQSVLERRNEAER